MTKAPTEKGVRTYKCSVCGDVMRTEEIEKLPPNSGSGDNNGYGSVTEETAHPQAPAETRKSTGDVPESPKTGQTGEPWWVLAVILLAAAFGAGMVLAVRKIGKGCNP